jgi:kynureninase
MLPSELFPKLSLEAGSLPVNSAEFAAHMDSRDELKEFRNEFCFPDPPKDCLANKVIYLCGNSLGLQPKGLKPKVVEHLDKWAAQGVEGHFTEPEPWLTIDDIVQESMSRVVGALPKEVAVMNSLTANIHFMMVAFYKPTATRNKILIEKKAFPSDIHAVHSQIIHHGYDVKSTLLEVEPRDGETSVRTEDILDIIEKEGDNIALVHLSGVQYYTGQWFDMETITAAGKAKGCKVGWDLAHAVGNVPVKLHDWGVDFANWCCYKYLNAGPGTIGGCFVHESNCGMNVTAEAYLNRFQGWWGHRVSDRFDMAPEFHPEDGAYGFRVSNPAVLLVACVRASLDLFDRAGMDRLREKSLMLTGYLDYLLRTEVPEEVMIFTPADPTQRGCQLSLAFKRDLDDVFKALQQHGIICDVRKPNIMRIAPTPLYSSFTDVYDFVMILKRVLHNESK